MIKNKAWYFYGPLAYPVYTRVGLNNKIISLTRFRVSYGIAKQITNKNKDHTINPPSTGLIAGRWN